MQLKTTLLILGLALITSCQSTENNDHSAGSDPADGAFLSSEQIAHDTIFTYAAYIPGSYEERGDLPVIIFLDPQGEGLTPVEQYKNLAAKYGVILMGSHDSRNGMPMMQADVIVRALLREATERFGVGGERVAVAGHSGGAKVALTTGARNTDITTVFYSGSATYIKPNHPITVVGFTGLRDMNYTDLIMFHRSLEGTDTEHYLIEWPGPHEWPAAEIYADAFAFLTEGKIDNYKDKQPTITEARLQEEDTYKRKIYNAFDSQNLDWWRQEIADLKAKKDADPMYERLLGFISLACNSFTQRALTRNDLSAAEFLLTIYEMADPGNPDIAELRVELEQRRGEQ